MTESSVNAASEINLIPEAEQAIRSDLIKTIVQEYKKFITLIRELPIYQTSFHQAFLFFDSGILWAKEAIEHAPIVAPAVASIPIPVEVPQADVNASDAA